MCTVNKDRRFMTTDRSALSSETALPDTVFRTQTAGHLDRLTDRLAINRNVTVSPYHCIYTLDILGRPWPSREWARERALQRQTAGISRCARHRECHNREPWCLPSAKRKVAKTEPQEGSQYSSYEERGMTGLRSEWMSEWASESVIRAGYGTSGWLFHISVQIGKWLWAAVQFDVAVCVVTVRGVLMFRMGHLVHWARR